MEGKRKKGLLLTFFILLFVAVAVFIYWYMVWRLEEYTDDAYVNGNMTQVNAQIPGIVVSINTDETAHVERNQLLIALDSIDYQIAYDRDKSKLGSVVRDV